MIIILLKNNVHHLQFIFIIWYINNIFLQILVMFLIFTIAPLFRHWIDVVSFFIHILNSTFPIFLIIIYGFDSPWFPLSFSENFRNKIIFTIATIYIIVTFYIFLIVTNMLFHVFNHMSKTSFRLWRGTFFTMIFLIWINNLCILFSFPFFKKISIIFNLKKYDSLGNTIWIFWIF